MAHSRGGWLRAASQNSRRGRTCQCILLPLGTPIAPVLANVTYNLPPNLDVDRNVERTVPPGAVGIRNEVLAPLLNTAPVGARWRTTPGGIVTASACGHTGSVVQVENPDAWPATQNGVRGERCSPRILEVRIRICGRNEAVRSYLSSSGSRSRRTHFVKHKL